MKAVLIWRNCGLFTKRQDGFWVQCPDSMVEEKILPHLSGKQRADFLEQKERYLSTRWATGNPVLLVEPDSYYFMISRYGIDVEATDPFFPYSSQWNGYCPLEEIDIIAIGSVDDLKACPGSLTLESLVPS